MTAPKAGDTGPKVGDQVLFVFDPETSMPFRSAWELRTTTRSLVVRETEDGRIVSVLLDDAANWWEAPPDRLKVVARASYEEVA